MPYAVKRGKLVEIDDREADYEFDNPNQFFSSGVNLLPTQSATGAPRAFYGAKFISQALPNPNAEAPLVQSLKMDDPNGRSWDDYYGEKASALRWSDADEGVVSRVANDKIFVKTPKGNKEIGLYRDFSLNRKTGITQTPVVKAGDRIAPGQLLARSNYTDTNGSLALGMNMLIGLAPYKGYSMDDALVVSQSAAKKLLSEKYQDYVQEDDGNIKWGRDHYRSLFPTKFNKDQLAKLDDMGVVHPGQVLQPGDPIILATTPRTLSSKAGLGRLSRSMSQIRQSAEEVWDAEEEGLVTGVARTAKGIKVTVKSISPTKMGDKLVIRSGQKGINSKIIPDELMPRLKDGTPLEVLLNPLGLPSRVNDGLIYELLLGKVAKRKGQPYKLPGFLPPGQKWNQFVRDELAKNGVPEEEEVFDPETGKVLENPITVGYGYVLKLHHEAASKVSARNQGIYDANQQPAKGGNEGAQAKRNSGLEVNGLRAAGAYNLIRENSTLRGQKNDEYWRAWRSGRHPVDPGRPFVFDKFVALLGGAGIKVNNRGNGVLRLGPMTDKSLQDEGSVEIKNGRIMDFKTFEAVKGGLFDNDLTARNKWGHISLPAPMPNPAYEDSLRAILGLKKQELEDILAGRMDLPERLR